MLQTEGFLQTFLKNSVINHVSYLEICDTSLKHFYVIQFDGLKGRSSDITINLQQVVGFIYKYTDILTSFSKDGEYKKINGTIFKTKKLFETEKLALQQDVFFSGYSFEESIVEQKIKWEDDTYDQKIGEIGESGERRIEFYKETRGFCHSFLIPDVGKIHVYENEILLFLKSVDDIVQYAKLLMYYIYPNTLYVLTKEYEQYIKNNTLIQHMKQTTKLFDYSYTNESTSTLSYFIHNYLETLPCLYFSLYGSIYILDIYDNLKKVG